MLSLSARCALFHSWLERRPLRHGALLIGLLSVVVFASMPARELTFDNTFIIGDDTRLRQCSAEAVQQIFEHDYWWPSLASSLYRPLTTLSFWFEYSFLGFGPAPFGYQCVNLLLNLGNALLVAALARRLGVGQVVAVVVAGIFALHPITTEVVANIVGRSDLFACTAVLAGLLCYLRALDAPFGDRTRFGWFAACGLCSLVGILAKENAVALAALIAWHGCCRLPELSRRETRSRWLGDATRALLCLSPSVLLLIWLRHKFTAALPGLADHPFIDNPLMPEGVVVSVISAIGIWGMQVKTLFLPLTLSSDYSFDAIPVARWSPPNATFWWGIGTLAAFMIGTAVLVIGRRRWLGAPFLFGCYFITMLPTSNILIKIGSIRAERFHYLPSAFFWIGLAVVISVALRNLSSRSTEIERALSRRLAWVVLAWCVCLGVLTHLRCYDWQSNITLWQSALDNAPGSVKAQAAVANERVRLRNDAEGALDALARIEAAMLPYIERKVHPADWPLMLFSDYGAFSTTLYDELSKNTDRIEEAKRHLQEGLKWMRKGMEYENTMRQRWAERWTDGDLEKAPMLERLHRNYALALHRAGETAAAINELDGLVEKQKFDQDLRELRARLLLDMGNAKRAAEEFMLLSVMMRESTAFVYLLGQTLQKLEPKSHPLIRDPSGAWRLDIEDTAVRKLLEEASRRYLALLQETGDDFGAARFMRTARHVYGLDPMSLKQTSP